MTWMIYGATGYTGGLIAELAKEKGRAPILAGRHPQKIIEISRRLNLPARVFGLGDVAKMRTYLKDVKVVLNCAGPFSRTCRPLLDACIKNGVHYLDITGEISVFEEIHRRDQELKDAAIVAIPGVGADVVPTDCLAALLAEKCPDACWLRLGIRSKHGRISPGTLKTMIEHLDGYTLVRRKGKITPIASGRLTRRIPFSSGAAKGTSIPWGDVSTAFHSTGIPNIEVYLETSPQLHRLSKTASKASWLLKLRPVRSFLQRQIERRIQGPSEEQRRNTAFEVWGEVEDHKGHTFAMELVAPDPYELTAQTALAAAVRIEESPVTPGFYTPSKAFGANFITEFECMRLAEGLSSR